MYQVTCEGCTSPFVAFSANVSVLSDGIHGGIVVLDAGDGLAPMALAASKIRPDRMNISGLLHVTGPAAKVLVEFNTPVGVHQAGTDTHLGRAWAVREDPSGDAGDTDNRAPPLGKDLVFFVVAGAGLILLVAHDRGGHFFLREGKACQKY